MPPDIHHDTHVRGVDPALWQQLRIEALRQGKPLGTILNELIAAYLATCQPPSV